MIVNRRCLRCKVDISERHHNCVRCEECQKEYRRWVNLYCVRKRDTNLIGTRDMKPWGYTNFATEHEVILQELRHLGLRPGKKGKQSAADKQGAAMYEKYVLNKKVNK